MSDRYCVVTKQFSEIRGVKIHSGGYNICKGEGRGVSWDNKNMSVQAKWHTGPTLLTLCNSYFSKVYRTMQSQFMLFE